MEQNGRCNSNDEPTEANISLPPPALEKAMSYTCRSGGGWEDVKDKCCNVQSWKVLWQNKRPLIATSKTLLVVCAEIQTRILL